MRYKVEISGVTREFEITRRAAGWGVRVDGGPEQRWSGSRLGSAEWRFEVNGVASASRVALDGEAWVGQAAGAFFGGAVADPRNAVAKASSGGQGIVKSPMPGLVARVLVEVGQPVVAGQVLLVVEAMKMENEFKSKIAGVVQEVHVAVGQVVVAGARLVTVEAG